MFFSKLFPAIFLFCNHFFWLRHSEKEASFTPRAYYISTYGSDQNEGTRRAPFRSIQRLEKLLLNPGDSILFEGNRRFQGSLELDLKGKGDPRHPYIISSYGNGYASINAGNKMAIHIDNAHWLNVSKLKLTGSGRKTGNTQNGISILHSSHIKTTAWTFQGFRSQVCSSIFRGHFRYAHIFP
jgi:hypothetical protein